MSEKVAITAEQRARAAASFRSCCAVGGLATLLVGFGFFWLCGGVRSLDGVLGEVITDSALFLGLTHWSRRGVTMLPGSRGFLADFFMLTILSLVFAILLGGLVWVVLSFACR